MCEKSPIQQIWGLVNFKLYSYKVLESRFKCNQGAANISFSASIPVHTIEWYVYY